MCLYKDDCSADISVLHFRQRIYTGIPASAWDLIWWFLWTSWLLLYCFVTPPPIFPLCLITSCNYSMWKKWPELRLYRLCIWGICGWDAEAALCCLQYLLMFLEFAVVWDCVLFHYEDILLGFFPMSKFSIIKWLCVATIHGTHLWTYVFVCRYNK